MKILLHAAPDTLRADRLEKRILSGMTGVSISRTACIDSLFNRLSRPMNHITIVLVFVTALDLLEQMRNRQELFDDKKLILVLPLQEKGFASLSLLLGPSFISDQDTDLTDVILVLNQIRQKEMIPPIEKRRDHEKKNP